MKSFLITLAASLIGLSATAQNIDNKSNCCQQPASYISVVGYAEREVVPNEIYLSITIDESAGKSKISLDDQESAMVAALKGLGINVDNDLKVTRMNSDLQSYFLKKDKVQSVKNYSLLLHDADTVADVFEKLGELNISQIEISRLSHSDLEQFNSELRTQAAQNARDIATELAGALDRKIDRAIYIEYNDRWSNNFGNVMYDMVELSMAKTGAKPQRPALQFKKLKLTSTVTVHFAFDHTYKVEPVL